MAYHPKSPSSPRYMSQAIPATPKFSRSSSRMSSVSRVSSDEDQSKTAVRVAIRVRPPLEPGQPGYELIPQRFQRSIVTVANDTSLIIESPQGRRNYIFDRVFNENVGQEGVMNWLKDAIDSFITGYNVSLLAYGQSGAGKSYTMGTSGPNEQNDPWQMGVIPRAARALFTKLAAESPDKATHTARQASGSGIRPPSRLSMQLSPAPAAVKPRMHKIVPNNKDWTLKATYVEIYNDELRDLLLPPELRDQERLPITIREDTRGTILLTGLREVVVNDVEDLLAALNYGSSIRQTDATAINARSSRSHAVFSLSLVQRKRKSVGTPNSKDSSRRWTISGVDTLNGEQGDEATVTISSKLHFVDLAGSERLKNTGAQGDRAKEGISINAGLAALGKVISQLSARSGTTGHISYRDSKLTRILSDSLGGNAITYMIACITPAEFHRSETLNTVQYAQRARAIQSRPQISEVLDEAELRAVVDRLKAEVASLREQLRNANKHTDDRPENRTAVEQELQDQLFDLQESYSGLSARHARLMAELSRERGIETSEITIAADDDPNSPMNRIKRSNSFAEAVEMVILEYEKTIQSLENTLAEVRASLAQTESTLLEKESKLAYAESINQQLNARVSKLTQREANTAEYVRKLETRLDEKEAEASGASLVEMETIQELRIENARLKDHEQSSEAYLAVLEENLAEADADIEFWKREVDRLERVVERQRGLRKLDTLLDELDEVQQEALEHAKSELLEAENAFYTPEPKEPEEGESKVNLTEDIQPTIASTDSTDPASNVNGDATASEDKENQAPKEAQPSLDDNFLRAELANLRKSHETTVRKLEDLTNTYNSSLECIAELKDQLDKSQEAAVLQVSEDPPTPSADTPPAESKDPPNLEIAGVRTLKTAAIAEKLLAAGPQRSFSRSRSSEHLSAGVSESYKNGMTNGETHDEMDEDVEAMKDEIEDLRQKVQGLEELRREHAKLTENYNESMDLLDELKGQLQRERPPPSPVQPVSPMRPGLIRSRSISDIKNVQNDRATRALDSLSAKFDDLVVDDELKKSLHASLSIVTTEIISKSSQCQQQASEIITLRADVDAKTRLISGLTKAQSRTADPAYISALENQMAEMESDHKQVVDKLKERQAQLIAKVEDLTKELDNSAQELEKHKTLQQDYRKLLNDILIDKRRNSVMSQSSVDSYPASASVIMTGTSRTELTSDYGDHDTLDKELAQADSEDEEEPDHTALIAELKSRLSVVDTVEHTRVVKGLRQELEEVRSAYEEDTSELQKTLMEVKSQLLNFSRQRSVSESSGSDTTKDGSESQQNTLEKVKNLQSQLSKRDRDHQEMIQLLDAAQIMSTERERKANELTASLQELQKKFNQQSSTVESLTAEMTQLKSQHTESLQELASTQIKAEQVQKKLFETETRAKSITAERDSALREMADVRDKVQTLAKQHDALVREMESSHKEEVQGLKKDNSEYLTIIQHLKDQVSESEASISTYLLQITSFQQKLEATNKDSDKAKRAKAAVDRDLKEIRNEVNVISRQKQEAKDKLAEVTEMLTQLQADYDNLKARKNSLSPETDAVIKEQTDLIQALEARLAEFETRPGSSADPGKRLRSGSLTGGGRWSNGTPTPPPTMPLPPLPGALPNPPPSPLQGTFGRATSTSRSLSRTNSQDQLPRSASRDQLRSPSEADALRRELEEKDLKIANLEKQFQSERQLVQTLEEALSDTEKSMKQLKKQTNSLAAEKEMLHTKMLDASHQLEIAKKEAAKSRDSIQQLDEARAQRAKAEAARRQLEDRMEEIAHRRRSKFSCF